MIETCLDVDECLSIPCGDNGNCSNTYGPVQIQMETTFVLRNWFQANTETRH